jgi:hypothetical protein
MERQRKNLLGGDAISVSRQLIDLYEDMDNEKINLKPCYQRNIRWNEETINNLIGTIMNNGLVPGIILYRLNDADFDNEYKNKLDYEYENIDGQHRLYTIFRFMKAEKVQLPFKKKKFIPHWNYINEETGEIQHVFYKKTDDSIEYAKENGWNYYTLTEKERRFFNRYKIDVKEINNVIPIDQRRKIFLDLQNGVKVVNSDYLKNCVDCKLIQYMIQNDIEIRMAEIFYPHCTKNAEKFWVQWVTRCFIMYSDYKKNIDNTQEENINRLSIILTMSDSDIKKLIKNNSNVLNPTDQEIEEFDEAFINFLNFLDTKCFNIKLNPTQIFALFIALFIKKEQYDFMDIIESHMMAFSDEGRQIEYRRLWESKSLNKDRRLYYRRVLLQMLTLNAPLNKENVDAKITEDMRRRVWFSQFEGEEGSCYCAEKISIHNFNCGHIISRVRGGDITLDNLRPICKNCNISMGTRNMREYYLDMLNLDVIVS